MRDRSGPPGERGEARYALAVLFGVNLLNYLDRQAVYAVFPQIKAELDLSDAQLGALASAFMVVYMTAAPALGYLGDRWSRRLLSAWGVACWSLATAASGLASRYGHLVAARAAVGIGEASYGACAPSLLADYYPVERRGRALAVFMMAIPVGSALGYILGGLLGTWVGWRAAFFIAGTPGLLAAWLTARLVEPRRGETPGDEAAVPFRSRVVALLRTPAYVLDTLAMAALTFTLGGLAAWFPTFLVRERGLGLATANAAFGLITLATGFLGTMAGGVLGDQLLQTRRSAYFLVSAWGLFAGFPFALLAILSPAAWIMLPAIFVAEFCLFLNTGPLNAVIANVSHSSVRATAYAVNIFAIHALGDALSPALLGRLSDAAGLTTALVVGTTPLLASGLLCLAGARALERPPATTAAG
jgi:predicted MFS family arabinose efflux permease